MFSDPRPEDPLLAAATALLAMGPDQVRALFNSMITVRQLPDDQRTHALDTLTDLVNDQFGGVAVRPHLTVLYVGRKHG